MKNLSLLITLFFTINLTTASAGSLGDIKELKTSLNDDGSHYVKFTFLTQVWARYTATNPGSMVYNSPVDHVFDLGLRRTRLSMQGKLTDKIYFYTQFGQNNFSYLSKRYEGAFFHDIIAEYELSPKKISIGGGLTGWSGLSRYASPSIGSILTLDAPLYQQTTNGISDQFLRKLSIYGKGKLGKLDYRIALTDPMAVENGTNAQGPISTNAVFASAAPKMQSQGYFMFQFKDQEANTTPYTTGTYLGAKNIINFGAGFIYQPSATWSLNINKDTTYHNMILVGFDVFIDKPVSADKNKVLTLYGAYHLLNFGPGYIRNIGVMNPATGTNKNGSFNGAGDGFPMLGTGNVLYTQIGYVPNKQMFANGGFLQVYGASQIANYARLADKMLMYEAGFNWFVHGNQSEKISINYQSRPVYNTNSNGNLITTERKGMLQVQFQVSI